MELSAKRPPASANGDAMLQFRRSRAGHGEQRDVTSQRFLQGYPNRLHLFGSRGEAGEGDLAERIPFGAHWTVVYPVNFGISAGKERGKINRRMAGEVGFAIPVAAAVDHFLEVWEPAFRS